MSAAELSETARPDMAARMAALDWARLEVDLDARGFALTGPLFDAGKCADLIALYGDDARFRSRVVMARHGFGQGEYKYFSYPLPAPIGALRNAAYPYLAPIANRWASVLGQAADYPAAHSAYLARCHAAGQRRPTPLMLKYQAGDYNCLHQDLYGELAFPLQLAVLLSAPERDFEGGEFVLVEQRPRRQSRPHVVPLSQGVGVIFAVNQRPQQGKRGFYRVALKHGVSQLRAGERYTLGVIFHDAA